MENGLGVVVLLNAPGNAERVAVYGLRLLRAALRGETLPDAPAKPDLTRTENAADYAGEYRTERETLTFRAEGETLRLQHEDEEIALELWGDDTFYTPHPAFARYPFVFGREEGVVAELSHGPAGTPAGVTPGL